MSKTEIKEEAQESMLDALIDAASREENPDVSAAIIKEATKMAKRWGISHKPGLPGTFA